MSLPPSPEDELLERIARGGLVSQDEYQQIADQLPPEALAEALAKRFERTGESRMLAEAARLFLQAGDAYRALEACSRAPRLQSSQKIIQQALPRLRAKYPGTRLIGKLLEEAFLVIDLHTGKMVRFPPILPARE
jgi:hypothetical protein